MATHIRGHLEEQEIPRRQYEALVVLLEKVIESGISEVGMSRTELHDRTGMPLDSARTALDYIARRGEYFTRTETPLALVNKQAQTRQRRKGYRPNYFYRMVDVALPEHTEIDTGSPTLIHTPTGTNTDSSP
jgi:hypothetical protein